MINWLLENLIGILQIIIGGFIAYHVFSLSKQLTNKEKLEHRKRIKKKLEKLKLGEEVYLINVKRYFKDYPFNREKIFSGYSHIRAEMNTTRFNGIEFFCGIKEIYKKSDGSLTLNSKYKKTTQEKIKDFEVGVIPYEWIEYVDLQGDEYGFVPLFFCYFKGRRYWRKSLKYFLPFGYPYKKIIYYKISENYHKDNNSDDMKFSFINEPISNK